jgi:hypothetical protein
MCAKIGSPRRDVARSLVAIAATIFNTMLTSNRSR